MHKCSLNYFIDNTKGLKSNEEIIPSSGCPRTHGRAYGRLWQEHAASHRSRLRTKTTSRGITIGDTSEAFLAAYGEYRFFTSVEEGDYQVLDAEEIPFDSSITTLLPTFFVDGLPIEPDTFCKENEIAKPELLTYLSAEDYLQSHTVVYYYLVFTWEKGSITDISSEYMDYNEDASYYNEFNQPDTQ